MRIWIYRLSISFWILGGLAPSFSFEKKGSSATECLRLVEVQLGKERAPQLLTPQAAKYLNSKRSSDPVEVLVLFDINWHAAPSRKFKIH